MLLITSMPHIFDQYVKSFSGLVFTGIAIFTALFAVFSVY